MFSKRQPAYSLTLFVFAVCGTSFGQGVTSSDDGSTNRPVKVQLVSPAGGQVEPDEVVERRRSVIENEAAVISVCASYIEAQFIYFRTDHNAGGFLEFAQRVRSTPGRHDGLYWAIEGDEDESPMGPQFAAAAITEPSSGVESHPYFGYYFKILLSQGPEASGGARDYRIAGHLIGGFGLVAWPAEYGVSGVHSFLVNHLGDLYTRDLGPDTQRAATGITTFAPDRSWTKLSSGTPTNERTSR